MQCEKINNNTLTNFFGVSHNIDFNNKTVLCEVRYWDMIYNLKLNYLGSYENRTWVDFLLSESESGNKYSYLRKLKGYDMLKDLEVYNNKCKFECKVHDLWPRTLLDKQIKIPIKWEYLDNVNTKCLNYSHMDNIKYNLKCYCSKCVFGDLNIIIKSIR